MEKLRIVSVIFLLIPFLYYCDNSSTNILTPTKTKKINKDRPPIETFYRSENLTKSEKSSSDIFEVFPISSNEVFLLGLDGKSEGKLYKLNLTTKELMEYDIGAIMKEKKGIQVLWLNFAGTSYQ